MMEHTGQDDFVRAEVAARRELLQLSFAGSDRPQRRLVERVRTALGKRRSPALVGTSSMGH
jgi:hypothetical protein